MKILHIIPSVSKIRGGPSRAVLDMVKALQKYNIAAEIITTNDDGPNLLDVPLMQWVQYSEIPTQFFPRFSTSIATMREFAFSSSFTTWLWQHATDYDLLHIHAVFSYTCTTSMNIARLKDVPYLNTPHGLLRDWALKQSKWKKQIYLKVLEQANLNYCQAIHFTSHQERKESSLLSLRPACFVLPNGISKPYVIPNARYQLRQYFGILEDEPIILFLARWHPVKGLEYLIPALSQITHLRFQFVLAGSGSPEYEAKIKSLISSSKLSDRTHIAGFVDGEIKSLLLQGSNLLVSPSHMESFGIAVLEALGSGTPALVTPGVALAPVIEQHQLGYVAELDVNAIASALTRCLTYPNEAKIMGDRARQFILENYTWDKIAAQLIEVYQSILDRQPLVSSPH